MKRARSWGGYPKVEQQERDLCWQDEDLPCTDKTMLAFGCGRSYGDVALNDGGLVLRTPALSRFMAFDPDNGVIRCQAGVTLRAISQLTVPQGWFLPVTPGTQFATLGGAIANDVHGKNHHREGTFGRHVLGFELLRSDGSRLWCNPTTNNALYQASIGGLGLTGLITTVELKLMAVNGPLMDIENIAFGSLEEGLQLFQHYDSQSHYTVAWIDCLTQGDRLGRGIFTRGEHSTHHAPHRVDTARLSVPFYFPGLALNRWSVRAFNELYYRRGVYRSGRASVDYRPFFYPLDGILNWNRIYGKAGFFQYQCVVPESDGGNAITDLLKTIAHSGSASFLAVLKKFGDPVSPGMLSFPMPGITLALDFPNKGQQTLALLERLDTIVMAAGGRVYPAKDARMSGEAFRCYFPGWEAFSAHIDPKFSSSFWRRVMQRNPSTHLQG